MTDQEVLARLDAASRALVMPTSFSASKMAAAENEHARWAREALKRGLIGYPSKRKHRERK